MSPYGLIRSLKLRITRQRTDSNSEMFKLPIINILDRKSRETHGLIDHLDESINQSPIPLNNNVFP